MKAIVLLSAGLDSTFNLYKARQEMEVVLALSFDYGQRAALKELSRARALSERFGIPHEIVEFPFLKNLGGSSLTDATKEVPVAGDVSIDDRAVSLKTAASVWVPNRNGLFLNAAACFADRLGADCVIPGFNVEEASTFPDNSVDYMKALDVSFSFSTRNGVRVKCHSAHLSKSEIVREAHAIGMDFASIWPCYFDGDKWCGRCESCLRSKRAFEDNGMDVKELFAC